MKKLPLIVISGYLGAGKTTLINRLLAEDHGLKLLVMVNDFGAINIDAELLASRDEDTLSLTNGCVCCTMGSDLFLALGDALDRRPRPDLLIIEASGVANPNRIANAAIAEPEMAYGGIVTVVDGENFGSLVDDKMIGPQLRDQVSQADILLITKTSCPDQELSKRLSALTDANILSDTPDQELWPLLLGLDKGIARHTEYESQDHPNYTSWSYGGARTMGRANIMRWLEIRPRGLFRMKGFVNDPAHGAWELHVVGDKVSLSPASSVDSTRLVAIGLRSELDRAKVDAWWQALDGVISIAQTPKTGEAIDLRG